MLLCEFSLAWDKHVFHTKFDGGTWMEGEYKEPMQIHDFKFVSSQ